MFDDRSCIGVSPLLAFDYSLLSLSVGERMTWLYVTSGVLVVFLLGYLIYALLRPEDF